jgi:hypothetical protein
LYDRFAGARIGYDLEPAGGRAGHQPVRPPFEVLVAPRHGTCLDLCLVFSAACLRVGLHPVILVVRGEAADHAVVAVWVGADHGEIPRPPAFPIERDAFLRELRSQVDQPGHWAVVDISEAVSGFPGPNDEPAPLAHAVERGAGWAGEHEWVSIADIGAGFDPGVWSPSLTVSYHPASAGPWGASNPVLQPPYRAPVPPNGDRGDLGFRLSLIRAEHDVVPFRPRPRYQQFLTEMRALVSGREPALTVVHLHGVGGAGKTRLVSQLAKVLAAERWHTGWLIDPLHAGIAENRRRLTWLATTRSPLLVGIDYAEGRRAEVEHAVEQLGSRRDGPTWLILTSRQPGQWFKDLERRYAGHVYRPVDLGARPENPGRFLSQAAAAIADHLDLDAPRAVPPLPPRHAEWTTLDLVMWAFLAVHDPGRAVPRSQPDLYDEILEHESRYWGEVWAQHTNRKPGDHDQRLLRTAAAAVTLCQAPVERTERIVTVIDDLIDDRGNINDRGQHVAQVLETCLSSGGRLALRPDPVADHLISSELHNETQREDLGRRNPGRLQAGHDSTAGAAADGDPLLARLVAKVRSPASTVTEGKKVGMAEGMEADEILRTPEAAIIRTLARVGTTSTEHRAAMAGALAELFCTDGGLWLTALVVAAADGGAPADALAEVLASETEPPVNPAHLLQMLPDDHVHLNPVTAAALDRIARSIGTLTPQIDDDPDRAASWATLLNDVAVRRSRIGDRAGALGALDRGRPERHNQDKGGEDGKGDGGNDSR